MRRNIPILFIIALMLTASAFIPILPIAEDYVSQDIAEADPLLPDLGFPTVNYLPSAEGTVHEDSILEFRETTDDDVMLYPDSDNALDQLVTDGSQVSTNGESTSGWTQSGSYDFDVFVVSGTQLYMNTTNDGDGPSVGYGRGWDHTDISTNWVDEYKYYVKFYYSFSVGTFTMQIEFEDGSYTDYFRMTDYSADTWHAVALSHPVNVDLDSLVETQVWFISVGDTEAGELWLEYISVRSPINYDETSGYTESFTDVSDWPYGDHTTDGDVMTKPLVGDNNYKASSTNIPSFTASECAGGLYYEFTIDRNASATAPRVRFMTYSGDDRTGDTYSVIDFYPTDGWQTKKGIIQSDYAIECLMLYTKCSTNTEIYFDYFRIGLSTEMGWQHDGSTTEAVSNDNSANWGYSESSDGDILNLTATRTGANWYGNFYIDYDTTATACDLERDYYQFVEIKYKIDRLDGAGSSFWIRPKVDGYYESFNLGGSTGDWLIVRKNLRAMSTVTAEKRLHIYYYCSAGTGNTGSILIEYVQYHSIANWSIAQVASMPTDTYMYVDGNGDLVRIGTHVTGYYFAMTYDAGLSVNTNTFNVWNLTISGLGSSYPIAYGFRGYVGGAWDSLVYDESRGVPSAGTLTNVQFYTYDEFTLSAIKFWEDAVAPTIEEKWSRPQDPDTSDDVTISIVTTDVVGVYEATATPLNEPSGSSVGAQTFTLIDTNPSGAMLWTATVDNSDLIAGHYVFEIDASDGANSDYEYLTFTVSADTQTTYIRIFDSLGDFVPFETFEVYRNGSRQYTDTFEGDTESAYQIQVKDRWGETLNTTTFSVGDQELVVTVEVYSLKVMSWHYDFVRFNVTRAGLTYSEIVTPLEVINFRLYTNTYDWAIDYLNGTSSSGDITLTNSTALLVTGSTISDVLGLVTTVNTMTTAINITTTTISNEVVTIQLMFDWSNTTLYNQSINIIAAFNWENTTLYNQTISIASLFNATNTVLYDQIILIQNMFDWENTTLYNQTISILNAFNSTNTVIYTQTVSILADISNVNSTIYAQTVQMLLDLENSNSTLYTQTVTLLANIANIDSDIVTQTVAILADIENVNSTIYAQTVQVLTDISNMNSTIYSQTIMILNNLSDLNATVYLVTDPTHLNPLILGYSLSDDYCDFTIVTNWHNASISIHDNDVLRTGPTSELLCPIRYPLLTTSGTHNLSVYVDGGNDSFWYNISYTVAEIIAFELEDWDVTPHFGVENYLECFFRTTWGNSTIYVYLNDSLQTSVLEQEGGISFSFWMSGISGLHNYVFNVTSGAEVKTITWDFYLPDWADTGLVVRWDMWTYQNNYTLMKFESNWMNCTYYVYLNSSLVATSYNDPVTLNFTRDMNVGIYNLTIYADGGTSTYTIKNIRYIVTEEGVSYDFSTVTGGVTYVTGDTYEDDVVIYENPTGAYFDQETVALIAVGGFLIMFTAFLVAREIKQRDREKTEREYSQ